MRFIGVDFKSKRSRFIGHCLKIRWWKGQPTVSIDSVIKERKKNPKDGSKLIKFLGKRKLLIF